MENCTERGEGFDLVCVLHICLRSVHLPSSPFSFLFLLVVVERVVVEADEGRPRARAKCFGARPSEYKDIFTPYSPDSYLPKLWKLAEGLQKLQNKNYLSSETDYSLPIY